MSSIISPNDLPRQIEDYTPASEKDLRDAGFDPDLIEPHEGGGGQHGGLTKARVRKLLTAGVIREAGPDSWVLA